MGKIDPERKAAAIADLLTGDQPAVVAKRYHLRSSTVRSLKTRLDIPVATPVATESVATGVARTVRRPTIEAQQMEIGELVMKNLRAKLLATQRIAEYVTTPEWLAKQTADVAALFTVLDQSATAILDRMASRANASAGSDSDDAA